MRFPHRHLSNPPHPISDSFPLFDKIDVVHESNVNPIVRVHISTEFVTSHSTRNSVQVLHNFGPELPTPLGKDPQSCNIDEFIVTFS